MNPKYLFVALLLAASANGRASAQVEIDKQQPAPARGEVHVENEFGSIEITGWDRDVVRVTGTLAAGAEGIELDSDEEGASIDVSIPEAWLYASDSDTEFRSTLIVQVPQGSSVYVETLNATVTVRGVRGHVEIETVNGPVTLEGDPASVEISSMTGNVQVRARAAEMEVESISGAVDLAGAVRRARVQTTSAAIDIRGESLEEVEVESVTGDVTVDGSFTAKGGVDIETHSGKVELRLPASVRAKFECETFSGKIDNAFGPQPVPEKRFHPQKELRFSTGPDSFTIQVQTFSGDIVLGKRSGGSAERKT